MKVRFFLGSLMAVLLNHMVVAETVISERAEQLFSDYKNSMLQIRMIDRTSKSKSSIGSGFFISDDGLIVTNFHVVADWVYKPERYDIRYLLSDKQKGDLTLLAVDVVHDLALLKMQEKAAAEISFRPFEFSRKPLRQGEHLYSFGNPHDIGLSIVEGTYNGYIEKSLYKKIHFTGSVNPGMSGGPVVDRDGRVVGVNVSGAGNQLSFLVPEEYVSKLSKMDRAAKNGTDFLQVIRDQILKNQREYMGRLLQQPLKSMSMEDYELPGDLGEFMKCWGGTQDREKLLYEQSYKICQTEDDIYLASGQRTGVIEYKHDLFRNKGLGKIRFFNLIEKKFNTPQSPTYADEETVTNYECDVGQVIHNGTKSKLVFCLRGYKKFDDVYDVWLTVLVLGDNQEVLRSTALLSGVSYENAIAFSKSYVEKIQWKK